MTYRGTARGRTIELEEELPFQDGATITISIESADASPTGSAAAILKAIKSPPHLDPAIVDELERHIEDGKLPVRFDDPFSNDE